MLIYIYIQWFLLLWNTEYRTMTFHSSLIETRGWLESGGRWMSSMSEIWRFWLMLANPYSVSPQCLGVSVEHVFSTDGWEVEMWNYLFSFFLLSSLSHSILLCSFSLYPLHLKLYSKINSNRNHYITQEQYKWQRHPLLGFESQNEMFKFPNSSHSLLERIVLKYIYAYIHTSIHFR